MNQSDPIELVEPGSLARPGPVGRLLRVALGVLCAYGLYQLVAHAGTIIAKPATLLPNLVVLVVAAIYVFNDVVNIGFGRSWRFWPIVYVLAALTGMAVIGRVVSGSFDNPAFGIALWLWLTYVYAHLGASFVLAAVIATPGCEMRSMPEFFGRIMGRPADEHHCPASFISNIDSWEHRKRAPR